MEHYNPQNRNGASFTLIELLIVIAIIGVLITVLLPSLKNARQKAMLSVCMSNQKQIALISHNYGSNNNHFLPRAAMENTRPSSGVNGRFWYHALAAYGSYEDQIYVGINGNDIKDLYHHSRQQRISGLADPDEIAPPGFLVCPSAKVQKKLGYSWNIRGWGNEPQSPHEWRFQQLGRYSGMVHTVSTFRSFEPSPEYRIISGDNYGADDANCNDTAKYTMLVNSTSWLGAYRHGNSLARPSFVTSMEDGHVEFRSFSKTFLATEDFLKYSYGYE